MAFPLRESVALVLAIGSLTLAPSTIARAATADSAEGCTSVSVGRCDYTADREGVHRIRVAVPATEASKLSALSISGQQCPLSREPAVDGTVSMACFAYLSGGMTYQLSLPTGVPVSIVKADPTHGEPVTLIP